MRLSELQATADRAGWNLLYTNDWELIRARLLNFNFTDRVTLRDVNGLVILVSENHWELWATYRPNPSHNFTGYFLVGSRGANE